MSRFNNPKTLTAAARPAFPQPSRAESVAPLEPAVVPIEPPQPPAPASEELQPSGLHKACFITLCAYLLSAYANDMALRFFHGKSYISTVTIVLLPLLFAATGGILYGIRTPVSKWLLAFGAWLAVCFPTSFWKSNTLSVLFTFYFRSLLLYYVICGCVLRLRELKRLMVVQAIGAVVVIFTCFKFGEVAADGRLSVIESGFSFLANANELSLQLLLGSLVLLFFVIRGGLWTRAICLSMIAVSAYYALRTGSRGGFLAMGATVIA